MTHDSPRSSRASSRLDRAFDQASALLYSGAAYASGCGGVSLSDALREVKMKAYMVIRAVIHDRDRFISGYGTEVAKLVERFGGKYLVRTPQVTALEGITDQHNSVVISEWPSLEAAQRFWRSEEYQEVKKLREGIADCYVLLFEAESLSGDLS